VSGQVLSNVAMLFGILLIAGGIVGTLLAGLDPLYSLPGLVAIVAGAALVWWGRKDPSAAETVETSGQRSVQRLESSSDKDRSKLNRKI
jgi:hypothetical protein